MDQVEKRGPGRPPKQPEAQYAIPLQRWMLGTAIHTRDEFDLSGDLRCAISGELGCLFTMRDGVITDARGRSFTVAVLDDRIELR